MINVGGKPVLWYHIQSLKNHGINEIWINLHSFPEVIRKYFGDGSKFGVKIFYSYEKELLGTAGALKNTESGIEKEFSGGPFIVAYGDVLANFDYKKLIDVIPSEALPNFAFKNSGNGNKSGNTVNIDTGNTNNVVIVVPPPN